LPIPLSESSVVSFQQFNRGVRSLSKIDVLIHLLL
jgi:hypothetical protein